MENPKKVTIKIHDDNIFEVITQVLDLEIVIIDRDGSKVVIKDGKATPIESNEELGRYE